MKKALGNLKDLILNKNYGKRFLGLNILYTIVPIVTSLIHHNKAWTVSLTIFLIYTSSYMLASISDLQYKDIGQASDPNVVLKAFSFAFSMIAMAIYSIISLKVEIPIESLYVYSYGIISLIVLFWLILNENTEQIPGNNNKFKIFVKQYIEMVCGNKSKSIKGILRGSILTFFIVVFIIIAALITSYKILSVVDKILVYIKCFV